MIWIAIVAVAAVIALPTVAALKLSGDISQKEEENNDELLQS